MSKLVDAPPRESDLSPMAFAKMLGCLWLMWLFVFVAAPWVGKAEAVSPLLAYIEETGIDASALYYTEVEEAAIAELGARSSLEYPATGRKKNNQ